MLKNAAAQVSSGLILGLSAVIYAVSYAALMFSGPLAPYVPYAISVTLVTAAVGGLYGRFSEEPTLVSGPDSNTSSVLAGILAGSVALAPSARGMLNDALVLLLAASAFTAACYLLIVRFNLARLVRFIPFQVMAGFLASTGWLMASGALNIIAGTPLTLQGLAALLEQPWRPELLAGLAFAALLAWLQRRLPAAVAIPAFVVGVSLLVNAVVRWGCDAPACDPRLWFFASFDQLRWHAPWDLRVDAALLQDLLSLLPSFFAVAFVGTLTVLLSLGSLELSYGRDFRLEQALRLHGRSTLVAGALGGYLGVISIGRSTMCRATGGGPLTGFVIAAVCVAVMLGLGGLLAWVPRAALGALVLFLGVGMLKQWVWDLRRKLPRAEWLEVLAILASVIAFGYVTGFLAGLLAACIFFVVNYSRLAYIALDSTLAVVRSSVVRNREDEAWLAQAGERCRVGRFDGFIFFGVASAIYDWYRGGLPQEQPLCLLDFSRARGTDPSAVAVLEKVIRAQAARGHALLIVPGPALQGSLAPVPGVELFAGLDEALERAEEILLAQRPGPPSASAAHAWLGAGATGSELAAFLAYLAPVSLDRGEALFVAGQASDEMYLVESGSLDILETTLDGRSLRLSQVRAGAMLGEMALYTGKPRTASAVAVEACTLRMLTRDARGRLQRDQPALAARLDQQVVLGLASTVARANALLKLG